MRKRFWAVVLLGMMAVPALAAEKVAVLSSGERCGQEYQGIDQKLGIELEFYGETPEETQRLAANLGSCRLVLTTPLYKAKEAELEKQGAALRQFLENGGGNLTAHRAVGMLYTSDEPTEEMFDRMCAINDAWHEHIPDRPTYVVSYVPVNFAQNAEMADILAVDPYPYPERPLTEISDMLDAAREATHGRKTVLCVPQSFGRETPEAWRAMAFLALTHGAKGLIWYPWNQLGGGPKGLGMHDKLELQQAARQLITELNAISPALTSS